MVLERGLQASPNHLKSRFWKKNVKKVAKNMDRRRKVLKGSVIVVFLVWQWRFQEHTKILPHWILDGQTFPKGTIPASRFGKTNTSNTSRHVWGHNCPKILKLVQVQQGQTGFLKLASRLRYCTVSKVRITTTRCEHFALCSRRYSSCLSFCSETW